MANYSCEIRKGSQITYSGETTAPSANKARSNIWWRYARSVGIPQARVRIFISNQMGEGYECYCRKLSDLPLEPEVPVVPPERKQLLLPFEGRLESALSKVFENK